MLVTRTQDVNPSRMAVRRGTSLLQNAAHPRSLYPTIRSRPAQNPAFSTFLSTLPTPVIGNSRDELDVFRRMRRALARLHQRDQLVRVRPGAFARDDDGGDRLAPFVVGHADHGDHRDIGMLRQHVLDLARKNVEAAGDDHVLLAVEDEQVAALVGSGDVAGMQPAALQGFGGLFRPLPVFAPSHAARARRSRRLRRSRLPCRCRRAP